VRSAARSGGPVPHRSYGIVIASRARDRAQSCCSFRAGARVILLVTLPTSGRVCLRGGLHRNAARWSLTAPSAGVARALPFARDMTARGIGVEGVLLRLPYSNHRGSPLWIDGHTVTVLFTVTFASFPSAGIRVSSIASTKSANSIAPSHERETS